MVKLADLMSDHVILAKANYNVRSVSELMERHKIRAIPVVDSNSDRIVRGIVTSTDLGRVSADDAAVETVMSAAVRTMSPLGEARDAARIMRKHHIHHIVVTEDDQVVGIVSSLDLLKLVEDLPPPG